MSHSPTSPEHEDRAERWHVLRQLEDWLEHPMMVLGVLWLVLLILELTRGLSRGLEIAGWFVWAVFVADFALRFTLAPDKSSYLRANWLTALSLLVPAIRVLRVARAFRLLQATRAARGLRLVKVIGSVNRGMRALGRSFGRRGFGYVAALCVLVNLTGAAAMYAFERDTPQSPLTSYGHALWWTAMMLTTMGSDYFPRSTEGRVVCVMLAVFAFAVFGYVTATLATFFVGRDAADESGELAGADSVAALREELRAIQREIQRLTFMLSDRQRGDAP